MKSENSRVQLQKNKIEMENNTSDTSSKPRKKRRIGIVASILILVIVYLLCRLFNAMPLFVAVLGVYVVVLGAKLCKRTTVVGILVMIIGGIFSFSGVVTQYGSIANFPNFADLLTFSSPTGLYNENGKAVSERELQDIVDQVDPDRLKQETQFHVNTSLSTADMNAAIGALVIWDDLMNAYQSEYPITKAFKIDPDKNDLEFGLDYNGVKDIVATYLPDNTHAVRWWMYLGQVRFIVKEGVVEGVVVSRGHFTDDEIADICVPMLKLLTGQSKEKLDNDEFRAITQYGGSYSVGSYTFAVQSEFDADWVREIAFAKPEYLNPHVLDDGFIYN